MTRNHYSKRAHSTGRSSTKSTITNDDHFMNLPDLSGLKEVEKQHILGVLLRDENLRNKHLSRFMQLRKEVNELEQNSQPNSTSVCALCQTSFGFLFNTGDPCPKCGAKVCKQCRLMYNVNDNGWLCQLCCKQMQLLSYSGEWIYTQRSNLRKKSLVASDIQRKSLTLTISNQNMHLASSSDTEADENSQSTDKMSSSSRGIKSSSLKGKDSLNRMLVQSSNDEHKLNDIKKNYLQRPTRTLRETKSIKKTQELSPPNPQRLFSSDDVDSLYDQQTDYTGRTSPASSVANRKTENFKSTSSIPESVDSFLTNRNQQKQFDNARSKNTIAVDCASVTSSEWGMESERAAAEEYLSSRSKISGSIQSLRNAAHRIPKPHLSISRSSLHSLRKKDTGISDTTSMKSVTKQINTNSNTQLSPIAFNSNPNTDVLQSSSTLVQNEQMQQKPSMVDSVQTITDLSLSENRKQTITDRFGSTGHLDAVHSDEDDDDDIDGSFEKAKMGSQLSINSVKSEAKARYGLDISGKIELKLTYAMATGAFDVFISKCVELAGAKRHSVSDPYVKIYLLPDRSKDSKRKTSIKKNTINPVFEEKFRYHLTKQDFEIRVLWISVWSQSSIRTNDFLGEIHIPLATCILDELKEYQLMARAQKNDLKPAMEPTTISSEIQFELTLIENPKNKSIGTLQINNIEARGIYHGKSPVDAICKGLLMPDKVKRKLLILRKGPIAKWELPLRWDGVRLDNLRNSSLEISIWSQERFKTVMLGFVRLNLSHGHFNNKPVPWLDATKSEKSAWSIFLQKPTQIHSFRLPLRPAAVNKK